MNLRACVFFGLAIVAASCASAQELTLSPYSRYAIGDIFSSTTTRNAAMGGIGIGGDNYFSVNRLNPASYGDILFTTMDVSVFGQQSAIRSTQGRTYPVTAGFHDLAFAFPSNKGPVFAMGFAPYSAVGYRISTRENIQLQDTSYIRNTDYLGSGGINQAFFGMAFRMLNRRLKIGVTGEYLFGNIRYSWINTVYRNDTLISTLHQIIRVQEDVYLRGFNGHAGILFHDTLNAKKLILYRIGLTGEFSLDLLGDRFRTFVNGSAASGAILDTLQDVEEGFVQLPSKFGIGFSVNRLAHWTFGADVMLRDWKRFTYFDDTVKLNREIRVGVGGEWTPNYESNKYGAQINYRAGAYWQQSYVTFDGRPINDYGVTLGIGLPAGRKGNTRLNPGRATSRINLSLELGRRGSLTEELPLEELYARVRLGFSVNDRWFIRRVVD
jgi:hypothetical protein